ncbi:MAG: hypothetical protein PHQ18_01485, partial [Patescibacteria group bacterium]|nr:hypothetical protein [Patescibacteria group bacterium]
MFRKKFLYVFVVLSMIFNLVPWDFASADNVWGNQTIISTNGASEASIAVDSNGNAIAVWHQSDGVKISIFASRYDVITGNWDSPYLIEGSNLGHAYVPKIKFDSNGNAIAVWYQDDGTRTNIWANRYDVNDGWSTSTARLIEGDNTSYAMNPQVAMDASGNAIAVWYQDDGTRTNIWANRYDVNDGWSTSTARL